MKEIRSSLRTYFQHEGCSQTPQVYLEEISSLVEKVDVIKYIFYPTTEILGFFPIK